MEILLLRHGQTEGNLRRAYVGSTDEPLCEEGRLAAQACAHIIAGEGGGFSPREDASSGLDSESLRMLDLSLGFDCVFSSPLLRAVQTAKICFPSLDPMIIPDLREMDFGAFEGKSYLEMEDDPAYREWVEGMCEGVCPGGECKASFIERTCEAFRQAVSEAERVSAKRIALVAHGGTLMSVLSEFADSERSYYDWHAKNCAGYSGEISRRDGGDILLSNVLEFPFGLRGEPA